MTAHDAFIAERRRQRRIARRIETAVLILILAAAAAVFFGYHPERAAAAWNHVDACRSTLRGYGSDNDVHTFGSRVGARSFGGWGAWGHYSDGSVYVWGIFTFSYGKVASYKGRCSGGDFASDWFVGY
jgi:hypothetical protein